MLTCMYNFSIFNIDHAWATHVEAKLLDSTPDLSATHSVQSLIARDEWRIDARA
jgi:hypothetical protein